ncbi:NAD(P)-binding protein [Rostrohypoxylon terebratum]|nr:NAD(P)-binding protein [Rostrohypoxylon terebratum]
MSSTRVLISGANRGLGRGLLKRYAAKENHIVIAANRDPDHPTSQALKDIPTGQGSRIIVVKLDASIESDAAAAVEKLTSTHKIEHLDLVIANAGIAQIYPTVSQLKASDLVTHMTTNVLGLVWLFQVTAPLLRKSANPKHMIPVPNAAYAPTKTMAHWMTNKIDQEEKWLSAFITTPGWVQTDLGNESARVFGYGQAPDTIDKSCDGLVEVIDAATKETHGGKMWNYDGTQQSW